jgi:hypothetical protein
VTLEPGLSANPFFNRSIGVARCGNERASRGLLIEHEQFGDNRESDLLLNGVFGSTAVSGSLGVVPWKRYPVIFEHVVHKGAYLER